MDRLDKINFIMKLLPNKDDYARMQSHGDMAERYEEFRERNQALLRGVAELHLDWLLQMCLLIMGSDTKIMDMEYCSDHTASGIYHTVEGKLCIYCPR